MPAFYAFKTIDIGSVAAGGQGEQKWASDDDYTIHKIMLVEKTGATLYKYLVTISIDSYVITKDTVPGSCLALPWSQLPELNVSLSKAKEIKISVGNGESAARDCYVVLELYK